MIVAVVYRKSVRRNSLTAYNRSHQSAGLLQLHTESLASARKLFESLAMDAENMTPFAEKLQKQSNLKRMLEHNTELSRTFCGALFSK